MTDSGRHREPSIDAGEGLGAPCKDTLGLDRRGDLVALGLVLLVYALAVIAVNPFRETAFEDDWAFALTVRHLLDTGELRMHDFAAPYTPFQIHWAAGLSRVLGYSFGTLRISTVVLMGLALVAFYGLAREHRFGSRQAGLLTLVFLASPLALEFSFTFMTDVPFLACVVVGSYLYTRALRVGSVRWMVAASAAGSAAVLCRQFGIAFVLGLLVVWALAAERRAIARLMIAGLVLPTVAACAQAYVGLRNANWAAAWSLRMQHDYLREVAALVPQTAWRLAIVLEYLAVFCLPLVLVAIGDWVRVTRSVRLARTRRVDAALTLAVALFVVAMNVYGRWVFKGALLMPLIPWNFQGLADWPPALLWLLRLTTGIGATLFGRIVLWRYVDRWRGLPVHERVIDGVTAFLVAFQLLFFQFGDEYLLPLLPFAVIVVGRAVVGSLDRWRWPVAAVSLSVIGLVLLWTRASLAVREAYWQAGESLIAAGVTPDEIHSDLWEWNSYHGAFEAYVAHCDCAEDPTAYERYFAWLSGRAKDAKYLVRELAIPRTLPPRRRHRRPEVLAIVLYRDAAFRERSIVAWRRQEREVPSSRD